MNDDPPLFAALQAMHGLTARHQLREDRRVSDYESFGTGRYGADDDPHGPPSPPLALSPDEADRAAAEQTISRWPFGRDEPAPPTAPVDPDAPVCCPSCGTGVHRDRLVR